jgi:hypothetical protein
VKRHDIFPHQNYTPGSRSSLIMAIKLKGRKNVCRYFTFYKNIYLLKFTSLSKTHCIFSIMCPFSSHLKIPEKGRILNVMASKKRHRKIMFYFIFYCKGKEAKNWSTCLFLTFITLIFVIPDVCVYNYLGGSIVNQHINSL